MAPGRGEGGRSSEGESASAVAPAAISLVVPADAAGLRLDRFLAFALGASADGPSRAELRRWIDHGAVRVAGRPAKPADKVRAGAEITVVPEPAARSGAAPEDDVQFSVLHVDDAVVVVEKPAGLVVHPARGSPSGTLVNGLLARGLFDAALLADTDRQGGEDAGYVRPGIVHRLDKGTSGVMVVARTARAREALKVQFADHSIERVYEALVEGHAAERTHDTLHGRHPRERMMFSTRVRQGKRAVTHVRVDARFGAGVASHVQCTLETGRTHQIRVHLAESGTPILGDPLYGRKPRSPALASVVAEVTRPLLHARVLGFVHPSTGQHVRFEVEPPADFRFVLAELETLASEAPPRRR